METMDSLEFHKIRYAEEFVFDELRWSRIRPCLRMIQAEQRKKGRKLTILDVGCGDGTVSRLFLEAGNKVFGVDIVPDFVERAIEKGIEAKTADVTNLRWEFGGHIRIFTSGTLKRLLEENGFAVEEITSNLVSFIPTRLTRRPWSVKLGRLMPGLGEVLIVKARKRAR